MAYTPRYSSVEALRSRLRLQSADRDAELIGALAAAEGAIEDLTGRTFVLSASATARQVSPTGRTWSDHDGSHLLVDDIGDLTGLLVETGSGTSWTTVTGWLTEPAEAITDGRPVWQLLLPSGAWPCGGGVRVRVTARWGWPAVPNPIVEAVEIQAARLWQRRSSPEGVIGSSEWGAVRVARVDPDVDALIGPYRRPGIG